MATPKVFLSYSHDSDAHKEWVIKLASDLESRGIKVIVDQWNLALGQDLAAFMSRGIAECDRVILVCSEHYVKKADGQAGGVGYEGLIITGEIVQSIDTKKFIPLIRGNASTQKMPHFLGARRYVDFCVDGNYTARLEELVQDLLVAKPAVGSVAFSGAASPAPAAGRVAGPSGLTMSGAPVLADAWFSQHSTLAATGLVTAGREGAMELRFALHDPISKSQLDLLNSVRLSEIKTFGWPIGILLENRNEFRPRPMADGIIAEVVTAGKGMSGSPSYDYWAARTNGDFYLLQSLFEDERSASKLFFDTRIVRVTESLLFGANFYRNLGVAEAADISLRISHRGLAGRHLIAASPNRYTSPANAATESVSETQIVSALGQIRPRLVDLVIQICAPLFMLFDFKQFDRKVYEQIVVDFVAGKIT
jgi:hypothetical protein